MKFLSLKALLLILASSMFFTSCIKDENDVLTDEGDTFIKIPESPENQLFFDVFTDVKPIDMFSVRRDAATANDLSTATSIKLKLDTTAINTYNEENETEFELLPDSLYTLGDGITKDGDVYTMNLNSGDFTKDFTVNLNGAKWDISHKYALAFNIIDSAGLNIKEGSKDVIAFISVKNQYDGIYSVLSGTVTRYTAPGSPAGDALSGDLAGNPDVILATAGPNSVSIPPAGATGSLQWAVGNNSSVAGIDGLRIVIDPTTNLLTTTSAANPTLANWAGKENRYDPETRTFYLGFKWNPTANVREYQVVLQYKEPR